MKVTLYIPCYNAAKYLDRVLPAALQQTFPVKEILVIDDGSTDNTVGIAQKYDVRIVRHGRNKGLGAARNTGIQEAKGEFVASIDSDVVPDKDWLKNLVYEFEDEVVVGVGGDLIETYTEGVANHWRNTFLKQSHGPAKLVNPVFLFGSNTVYRRSALVNAGLYDEKCRTNGEDVGISRKIRDQKGTLVYNPAAKCRHLRQDTFGSVLKMAWRWGYFGNWKDVSLPLTVRANIGNCWRALLHLRRDIFNGDISNILVDLSFPLYGSYLDWKNYLKRL